MDALMTSLKIIILILVGTIGCFSQRFELTKQIKLPATETLIYSFEVVADYLCLIPLDGKIISPINKVIINESPIHYYHSTKVYPKGDFQFLTYFNKVSKKNFIVQYKRKQKVFDFEVGAFGIYRLAPIIDSTFCVVFGFDKEGHNFTIASKEGIRRFNSKGSINSLVAVSLVNGFLAINNQLIFYNVKDNKLFVKKLQEFESEIFDISLWDDSQLIISTVSGTYLYNFKNSMHNRLIDEFGAIKVLNNKLYVLQKNNTINVYDYHKN